MPIIKSAKKALRSSKTKRTFNLKRKNDMANAIKTYKKLVAAKKMDEAKKMIPQLQKAIDKASKRGVIKANNGSRKKSRLIKVINFKTA